MDSRNDLPIDTHAETAVMDSRNDLPIDTHTETSVMDSRNDLPIDTHTHNHIHKYTFISIPYSPTNAHSQFIKTIKIIEYYSNMFRFTQKPSSGSQSVLAKITYVVHLVAQLVMRSSSVFGSIV